MCIRDRSSSCACSRAAGCGAARGQEHQQVQEQGSDPGTPRSAQWVALTMAAAAVNASETFVWSWPTSRRGARTVSGSCRAQRS
eukprot:10295923-Alexandrium_andersonii.AAC.1